MPERETDVRTAVLIEEMQRRWPALEADEIEAAGDDMDALAMLLELRLGYAPHIARADLEPVLRLLPVDDGGGGGSGSGELPPAPQIA